jgi:hypothetical protein
VGGRWVGVKTGRCGVNGEVSGVIAFFAKRQTLCLESLGVAVVVCWANARVYPLANPKWH